MDRGEVRLRGGYPSDISTEWGLRRLTAMAGITVPRDGFSKEISPAAVWAGEARINAHRTYFGVVRHEGGRCHGCRTFVHWLQSTGMEWVRKGRGKKKSMWVEWRSRRKRYGTGNDRWLQREMEWSEHEAALERGHRKLAVTAWRRPRDRTRTVECSNPMVDVDAGGLEALKIPVIGRNGQHWERGEIDWLDEIDSAHRGESSKAHTSRPLHPPYCREA